MQSDSECSKAGKEYLSSFRNWVTFVQYIILTYQLQARCTIQPAYYCARVSTHSWEGFTKVNRVRNSTDLTLDSNVAALAPAAAPRVLQDPVVRFISDEEHGVIDFTSTRAVVNATLIKLHGRTHTDANCERPINHTCCFNRISRVHPVTRFWLSCHFLRVVVAKREWL